MKKTEITVVDSLMGSGKTSWAIDLINANPEDNFLYITPFLDEVTRIIKNVNREFQEPINHGDGKLGAINDMLACQMDIASTHALFRGFNEESREHIKNGNYTLILDEVLNVIEPYNDVKPDDMKFLQKGGFITIDDEGYVVWDNETIDYDIKYNEIKNLANSRSLLCVNQKLLLWRYPPEIFTLFDKVYILTYMFDASILKYYFDLYGIDYNIKSIKPIDENNFLPFDSTRYEIVDYFVPDTSVFLDKINIYSGKMNENIPMKNSGLSASWFRANVNKDKIAQLRKNILNYFRNVLKAKSDTIMWTSFKESKSKLRGKGYSNRHVACNCRSTNDYANTYNLAYCINVYLHPAVSQFFLHRGIEVDQNRYALSEMIQWIWRSRIRNGEDINIYIPSNRMRGLLQDWLNMNLDSQKEIAS
ncbi:MAG: hypothetical protein LUH07_02700 [Lachnospiraceae bacterium]|nr:hypothetical protein [Lachnospiraceae bacterium]